MILDIYKDSLEYSAKDWKILIKVGVIFLFSFLILPIFLIYGYEYRVIKIAINGIINGRDPLPEVNDIIDMWVDGIKLAIVKIIYSIIPVAIFIIFLLISSSTGEIISSVIITIGSVLTCILGILSYLMSMIGTCNMIYHKGAFKKAFDFKEIFETICEIGCFNCIATYVGLTIISFVIIFVVTLIILFIFSIFGFSSMVLGINTSGVFIFGYIFITLIVLFILGPYITIFNARATGLLYNMQI